MALLHHAAQANQTALIAFLLARPGCSVDVRSGASYQHRTPLHIAALNGLLETAIQLVRAGGANPLLTDSLGLNALHLCAIGGRDEGARLTLLQYFEHKGFARGQEDDGVPPMESLTSGGETICHIAAREGQVEIVRYLATKYPHMLRFQEPAAGRLPIHYAAESPTGNASLRFLVGLDPSAAFCKDKNGMLPLQLAHRKGLELQQASSRAGRLFRNPCQENMDVLNLAMSPPSRWRLTTKWDLSGRMYLTLIGLPVAVMALSVAVVQFSPLLALASCVLAGIFWRRWTSVGKQYLGRLPSKNPFSVGIFLAGISVYAYIFTFQLSARKLFVCFFFFFFFGRKKKKDRATIRTKR
jgi:ankyrin repeat protein